MRTCTRSTYLNARLVRELERRDHFNAQAVDGYLDQSGTDTRAEQSVVCEQLHCLTGRLICDGRGAAGEGGRPTHPPGAARENSFGISRAPVANTYFTDFLECQYHLSYLLSSGAVS